MNLIPPTILDMRFPTDAGRRFHLWLPLFLLWPLVWLVELLVLVPAAVFDVFLWLVGQEYHRYTLFLLNCFGLMGDTRGLVVRVSQPGTDIDMTIL